MAMRGVSKQGASTVTTQFTGVFRDDPNEQSRFFNLAARAPPRHERRPMAALEREEGLAFQPKFGADGLLDLRDGRRGDGAC